MGWNGAYQAWRAPNGAPFLVWEGENRKQDGKMLLNVRYLIDLEITIRRVDPNLGKTDLRSLFDMSDSSLKAVHKARGK